MWTKGTNESPSTTAEPIPRPTPPVTPDRRASLGPSIVIQGTLSGEEDLLIEGRVEGEIVLRKHSVTVGEKGQVKANIASKSIVVEGQVRGDLRGADQVTIRRSGKVHGNVTAPRVTLEDGAKFKGAIDMQSGTTGDVEPAVDSVAAERRPARSGSSPRSVSRRTHSDGRSKTQAQEGEKTK